MGLSDQNIGGSFVCDKHKLIYINSAKAACTTTRYVMALLNGKNIPYESIYREPKMILVNKASRFIRTPIKGVLELHKKEKSYKIFTVSRNPYSRVVSYYLSESGTKLKNMSFDKFLMLLNNTEHKNLDRHLCTQWDNLCMDKVDEIIRFEDYENEMRQKIFNPINVDVKIPKFKYSGKYDYRDFYNEEWQKDIIKRKYYIDLRNLKYEF